MSKYNFMNKQQTKEEKFEVALSQEDVEKIDKMVKIAMTMSKANSIFSGKLIERYMMKWHGIKEVNMIINEKLDVMIDQDIQRIRQEALSKSQQS